MKGPSAAQKEEVEIKLPFDMSPSKKRRKNRNPRIGIRRYY